MDKKKTYLTNEHLASQFKSKFELVRHAIKVVENMIITGREPRIKTENQNKALIGLEEIAEGKDWIDEVKTTTYEESIKEPVDGRGHSHPKRSASIFEGEDLVVVKVDLEG